MDNITIRLAKAEDLSAIVAIYNSTIDSKNVTAELNPVTVDDKQTWFDAHQVAHRPMYVMEDNKENIVAWATYSDYNSKEAYRITAEISVYLAQSHRKRGLGKKMVNFMLDIAPSLGIRNVIALIFAHNAPSLCLFERLDFALWGALPDVCDMGDNAASVLILGKRLQ